MDISDLPDMAYYRDQRCEELEGILGESPDYKDCVVKRFNQLEEFKEQGDPFDVQDATGEHLVWLFQHEVDTLDASEIVVFSAVQRERERASESMVKWIVLTLILLFIGSVGIATTLVLWFMFTSFSPLFPFLFPLSVLVLVCGILVFYIEKRVSESMGRDIDFRYASENPAFLSALQKLAPLSDPKNDLVEDYNKRLTSLEEEMTDI